jgi:hypothetical protein
MVNLLYFGFAGAAIVVGTTETSTCGRRFHKKSLHRLTAVPLPFQGRLISGSLEKGAGSRRLTEG